MSARTGFARVRVRPITFPSGGPSLKGYTCDESQLATLRAKRQMTAPLEIGKFVGVPVHVRALNDVSIAENTYAAGMVQAQHAHDAPLLSLVIQGDATEETKGGSRELRTQTLLYTPAYERHGHRFVTPGRWLNIQFTPRWLTRFGANSATLPSAPLIVAGGSLVNWASRLGAEIRQPDAVSDFAIEGALLLLLSDLSRLPSHGERRRPRWFQAVEDALEASIAAPPSVTDLAALAGVHPSHLLRTFRHYHGCTIATYVRRKRIERARAAIASTTLPLSMIALDAGYADQSHFTRVFREAYGETPGQYARSLKRG